MLKVRYFKIILLCAICIIMGQGVVFSIEDRFTAVKKIQGKYFQILYEPGVDVLSLLEQLNIGPADRILAGKTAESESSPEQALAEMLDTLFIRVSDTLDMRLYNSFEGVIKICESNAKLHQIFYGLFSNNLNSNYPFYMHSNNTIYISAENFSSTLLGHEIAHAVISHYFVVLPSIKIQEVLAGYVEYQLRKDLK